MTTSMFWATALLFALPALIGAIRWPWETPAQRASAALSASVVALVAALAWWLDVVLSTTVNDWMSGCFFILPVMAYVVYSHGGPLLRLRDDLDVAKATSLSRLAWTATGFFLLAMLVAMGLVLNRILTSHG